MGSDMSWQEALDWLVKLGIVPTWDSLDRRILFRKERAVKRGIVYSVDRQFKEKTWPIIIKALGMNAKEDAKRIRDVVRSELRKQGRM